jgi:hypothetical protein
VGAFSKTDAARLTTYPDQEIGDPDGTLLPSETAAIEYARRVIDHLREDHKLETPGPIIVVRNEAGEIVYQFPSN